MTMHSQIYEFQVFVDETYVGGYPEFKNMYRSKQIQKMLRPVMVNKPIAHCVDCKQASLIESVSFVFSF